jgi:hypothetical protein
MASFMTCSKGYMGECGIRGGDVSFVGASKIHVSPTDILQYRLRFGFSLLYKTVFHLNSLTAQLSYEGRTAVEGAK